MYKTVILIVFVMVLVLDFIIELVKKRISIVDLLTRAFMIIAFCYICEWF